MSCALLWWVSRGMSWTPRLAVALLTLVFSCCILLFERSSFWSNIQATQLSRHRRRDELRKSCLAGELCEPAFEMRQLRFADSFDPEPAPCIGTERNIGEGEIIAFDEAPRRQLSIDDAPLHGLGVGIFLDRDHVSLFGRRSPQRPKHRTIDRLQGRKRPVEPTVDAGAQFRRLRIKWRALAG